MPNHMLKPLGKNCQFTYPEEVFLASRFNGFYQLVDRDLNPETSKNAASAKRYLQVYYDFFFGVREEFIHYHRARRSITRTNEDYIRNLQELLEKWYWDQYERLVEHEEACSGC